jgi:serine/threonine-protein kinase
VGGDETGQKVTKTGLVVGTPEFMSPEQLSGDKVDGRSDLYSLALVYFRMLTGHLPFQADTVQETMIKRLTDEPAKLSATRPDLSFPAGLQNVLDSALVRTPGERYQTVAKFAEDVTGAVQLRQPTRGAATPATRAQAELEDRTQMIDSKQTRARTSVQRPGKKRSLIPIVAVGVVVLGAAGGGYILFAGSGAGGQAQSDSNHVAIPESTKIAVVPPRDTVKYTSQTGGQTGGQTGTQTTHPRESTITTPPRSTIDVAHAFGALDDMMLNRLEVKTNAPWIRDSALKFFNASGIAPKDKAYAAFVAGNAFFTLNDRTEGCRWVRTAVQLDPSSSTYAALVGQCQD